ncbi:uncharacterized protein LOC142616690 [Castanea sativa]|uniref:uncharacterized protein LOC142616690 n=1 Tax=Castanea sativa TaxID=21020 RepID=UPI003F64929C
MNTKSEKSTESATPLWKRVTKLEKVGDENQNEMQKLEDAYEEYLHRPKKPKLVSLPTDFASSPNLGPSESSTTTSHPFFQKKEVGNSPLEKAFNNQCQKQLDSLIARTFYYAGLPFHFAKNPYWIEMIKFVANNKLRTTLLYRERAHIEKLLKSIKETWKEKGLSIIIGEVWYQHVVQIITDDASVMKATGSIVEAKYPHIFWSLGVVHTLNLALRNICAPKNSLQNEVPYNECKWVAQVADEATFIRIFITNHSMRLAIFNSYSPLKLFAVAETRFASVAYILRFTGPIYEMLRVADTDAPILHKVYEMWDSMIENVKKETYRHEGKEDYEESPFYEVVHSIILINGLRKSEEVRGSVTPHKDAKIFGERNKCLKRFFSNLDDRKNLTVEFGLFTGIMAYDDDNMDDRWTFDPMLWWSNYGSKLPMLQTVALKLLGQPCSSLCAKRNWSTYGFIHCMRNRITPKCAEDLVFVHSNLRLLSRRMEEYTKGNSKK